MFKAGRAMKCRLVDSRQGGCTFVAVGLTSIRSVRGQLGYCPGTRFTMVREIGCVILRKNAFTEAILQSSDIFQMFFGLCFFPFESSLTLLVYLTFLFASLFQVVLSLVPCDCG